MTWLNSDTPGDESPRCACCGEQIGVLVDAVAMRRGTVRSSGRLQGFRSGVFDDGDDVKWFHFSCLEMFLCFHDVVNDGDATECSFCPEDLLGEPSCYELELGSFDIRGNDTWWIETLDEEGAEVRTQSCRECVELPMTNEDEDEMRRMLGMDQEVRAPISRRPPSRELRR